MINTDTVIQKNYTVYSKMVVCPLSTTGVFVLLLLKFTYRHNLLVHRHQYLLP